MDKYIYSLDDIDEAAYNALKDVFGWDHNSVSDLVARTIKNNLKDYVNLYRFYDRNCPGCVCGNQECDFAYGRGDAHGARERACKGEIFDCPVRVNGTMTFSREQGFRDIDSDRGKPPYPIISRGNDIKGGS